MENLFLVLIIGNNIWILLFCYLNDFKNNNNNNKVYLDCKNYFYYKLNRKLIKNMYIIF